MVQLLLHCCHPETSFVVDLQFYNGDTGGTLVFRIGRYIRYTEGTLAFRIGESLFAFLSVLL